MKKVIIDGLAALAMFVIMAFILSVVAVLVSGCSEVGEIEQAEIISEESEPLRTVYEGVLEPSGATFTGVQVDTDYLPIIQVRYLLNSIYTNEKGHGWYEIPAIVLESGEIKIQPTSSTGENVPYRLVIIE